MSFSGIFSIRPFTMRALSSLYSSCSTHVMMGVDTFLVAFRISLIRGTPRVTFMLATPAKWNVFSVICVAGSPIDCAATTPTASPGISMAWMYLLVQRSTKMSSCARVGQQPVSARASASAAVAAFFAAAADAGVSPGSSPRSTRLFATPPAKSSRMNSARLSAMCERSEMLLWAAFTSAQNLSAHGPARLRSSSGSSGHDSSEGAPPHRLRFGPEGAVAARAGRRTAMTCLMMLLKLSGLLEPSIFAGFRPSSPKANCTTWPPDVRTVISYFNDKSSRALIKQRCKYPVDAVFTEVSTKPSRPPIA
mmetsp:Transcript_69402/g.196753  ORF Transcript_69402/g.196753 Transcript_69402/m.196753 type:complete len:307 (+) Transcript_69402:946-1866(+)